MKVYVDTSKLESHDIQSITDLGGKEFKQVRMWFENTDNVEVQSLADYTKQVRKEVCEEIRELANKHYGEEICSVTMETILDQIQEE